jgi:DNA-binding MarR family transcriptional regulator
MSTASTLTDTVAVVTRTFAQMETEALREGGFGELSLRQIACLDLIQRLAEPTPGDLARELGITRPSVSGLIARLMAGGFIRKERTHQDARSFHLHLTEQGLALMSAHQRTHEAIARRLLAGLDEHEQHKLVTLLAKVADHIAGPPKA